jgi:hypothetical protein
MRGEEALHSTLSQFLLEQLGRYSGQQVQREGSPLKGNSVVAGEQNFLNFSSVLENQRALVSYSAVLSPNLDNREWNRRIALNAILKGQSLKIFSDEQRTVLEREVWGPWARDLSIRKQFLEDRLSAYVMVKDNLDKALIEYNVTYVALDVQAQTPAYLSQGWILRQRGHYWQIWERVGP